MGISPQDSLEPRVAPAGPPPTHGRSVVLKPWMLLAVALVPTIATVAAWYFPRSGGRDGNETSTFIVRRVQGAHSARHIGPWGELISIPFTIQPPADSLAPEFYNPRPIEWQLGPLDRAAFQHLLTESAISAEHQEKLLAGWANAPARVRVDPRVVADLSPAERAALYPRLQALSQGNADLLLTYYFSSADRDEYRAQLPAAVFEVFDGMIYPTPKGGKLCFSDLAAANHLIESEVDRLALLRLLCRQRTLLLTLALDPTSPVEQIRNYWRLPTTRRQTLPMIESLARQPRGASLDLLHLMPPFVREYAYTYPLFMFPFEQQNEPDCVWTSVNFSAGPRSDAVSFADASRVFETGYEPITGRPEFGDLMMLVDDQGAPAHVAVHVADNIVFTKNGNGVLTPWIFMYLEDLMIVYSNAVPEKTVYLRSKPKR